MPDTPTPPSTSCLTGAPFVKLQPDGQASILNYNLPQQTAYDSVAYLGLSLGNEQFKGAEVTQITSPSWDAIDKAKTLSVEGIKEAVKTDIGLIQNYASLEKNTAQMVEVVKPLSSSVAQMVSAAPMQMMAQPEATVKTTGACTV